VVVERRLTRKAHRREVLVDGVLNLAGERRVAFVQITEHVLEVLPLVGDSVPPQQALEAYVLDEVRHERQATACGVTVREGGPTLMESTAWSKFTRHPVILG
jgi:hypothetical protein